MIETIQTKGCICEPCSDISPNWKDIRTKFGYTMLSKIDKQARIQKHEHCLPTQRSLQSLALRVG